MVVLKTADKNYTEHIVDALTDGGLGIALLSPFDTTRYFFPFRPFKVSPIGIRYFFSSPHGPAALVSEILWIWFPLIILLVIAEKYRKKK